MAKKGKRRIKSTDRIASAVGKQKRSGVSKRRVTYRRYAVWSIGGLIVIMAAISGWAIVGKSSSNLPKPASTNLSPAATPVAKPASNPAVKVGTDTTGVSGGPQISYPETSHDFGTISQGAKVSHTFIVRNVGDAPLRLIKAAGS